MAYTKQTWTDNVTQVTASRLTHIEDGIGTAQTTADSAQATAASAATAAAAAQTAAAAASGAGQGNLYVMDVWDGVGTAPVRPTFLAPNMKVLWQQPISPAVDATHARAGDAWRATA